MLTRPSLILTLIATAALSDSPAAAQRSAPAQLRLVSRRAIGPTTSFASLGLSGANKPNGRMYRLRQDIPAKLPAYVPREDAGLQLYIAGATADGWLAFYRSPPGRDEPRNARFAAALFGANGQRRWSLGLNPMLSRPDHVEITDVRYVDGRLYFNESCQSYAREAGRRCSALVRVDPVARRVEWRTRPLVSNGIFLPTGAWIVAGYGFTAEPDALYLVDRATGRILSTAGVDSAPDYMEMKDGRLHVTTTRSHYVFRIVPGRG